MFGSLFRNVSEAEKNAAIASIIEHSSPRPGFFLMLALAVSMAAFGVILQSTVILIGSMLVAPLLYPVLSLGLGVITSDEKLIGRSVMTILRSALISIVAAVVIGFLFAPRGVPVALDIVTNGASPFIFAIVAVIAGFAGAYATTKSTLNEILPGAAIAVALVPPLATTGIALALGEWNQASNALLLFLVNVIGIAFSAMVVFSLFEFSKKAEIAAQAVKEDEKEIKKEAERANGGDSAS